MALRRAHARIPRWSGKNTAGLQSSKRADVSNGYQCDFYGFVPTCRSRAPRLARACGKLHEDPSIATLSLSLRSRSEWCECAFARCSLENNARVATRIFRLAWPRIRTSIPPLFLSRESRIFHVDRTTPRYRSTKILSNLSFGQLVGPIRARFGSRDAKSRSRDSRPLATCRAENPKKLHAPRDPRRLCVIESLSVARILRLPFNSVLSEPKHGCSASLSRGRTTRHDATRRVIYVPELFLSRLFLV